ncbi:MAG: RsmB/NOP family class I SAM-dependent RNA methyltransferase [Bacteroidetes bacterium]|nr:RsmB/NOP family class I SAM-dependent RNA methyltransferase [Bacteroidota bacterium]
MITLSPDVQKVIDEVLPGEQDKFLECLNVRVRTKLRLSSVKMDVEKTLSSLSKEGLTPKKIDWLPDTYSYEPETAYPGRTLVHNLGYLYLQDLSSMIPAFVLDPQPGERILDLAAAPGSKTTQIAQMMKNTGTLVANDADSGRLSNLSFNLDRMGIYNTVVTHLDGTLAGKRYPEYFDRVLLDAPCSALGVLANKPDVLNWWAQNKVAKFAALQEKLLISAIKALKPGGRLVYSTCTLTQEENEGVVQSVLLKYPVELETIPDLPGYVFRQGISAPGISPEVSEKVRRIYPFDNDNNLQGFFVASFKKLESTQRDDYSVLSLPSVHTSLKNEIELLGRMSAYFGIDPNRIEGIKLFNRKDIWVVPKDFDVRWAGSSIRTGMRFAREMYDDAFKLTTDVLQLYGRYITKHKIILDQQQVMDQFQSGSNISWNEDLRGQQAVFWGDFCLGSGLGMGKTVKSQIPRSKRMASDSEI